jgi:transposase
MAPGRGSWRRCKPAVTATPGRSGRSAWTPPWSGRTDTRPEPGTTHRRTYRRRGWRRWCRLRRSPRAPQGAGSNDKNADPTPAAAADREALGRSRGGLSTKIHLLGDAGCRPLARATTAGQRHDSLAFEPLMRRLKVARTGPGRPRTRPDRLLGDKAYSNRKIRAHLHRRGIKATIPEKTDQRKARVAKGSAGGRPPSFDAEPYKQRNTVERAINKLKDFRAVAMRTDKREFVFRGTIDVASIKIWLRNPANQDPPDTP